MSQFTKGLYICDGCDEPITEARLIVLHPNEETLSQMNRDFIESLRGVLVGFCKTCNQNEEVVRTNIQRLATEYNAWVAKQTNS